MSNEWSILGVYSRKGKGDPLLIATDAYDEVSERAAGEVTRLDVEGEVLGMHGAVGLDGWTRFRLERERPRRCDILKDKKKIEY